MRKGWLVLALVPATAHACEPIVPLVQVLAGPVAYGLSFYGLALAIGLKAVAFSRMQRTLPRRVAAGYMVLANLLTTFIGVLVASIMAAPALLLEGLPLAWLLSLLPSRRLIAVTGNRWLARLTAGGIAGVLSVLLLLSAYLWSGAQAALLKDQFGLYWLLKLAYLYPALMVSIVITAFWEEWAIGALAARRHSGGEFVEPVLRSNLLVLLCVLAIAALAVLPARLRSPDFLVEVMARLQRLWA